MPEYLSPAEIIEQLQTAFKPLTCVAKGSPFATKITFEISNENGEEVSRGASIPAETTTQNDLNKIIRRRFIRKMGAIHEASWRSSSEVS
jgi:hypothetical protein